VNLAQENRRTQRFDCRGVGAVQKLPAVGTAFRARVENLSEGGCLMELETAVEFELNETVELTFEVNHMAFRIQAEVRAVRSKIRVGFQFRSLSEARKNQLRDLIDELHEASQRRSHSQAAIPNLAKR
jgi:c-di-GMP-binding flagellar brake protein YcgR